MKQTIKWFKENKWAGIGIIAVLLALVVGVARADTDVCMTGSWHDPTVETEGVNLEVLDAGVLVYFYSYAETGNGLRWYYMLFDADGKSTIGTVKNKASRDALEVGYATFDVISKDEILIMMNITVDIDAPPWCLGCERTLVYTRLTEPVACE